MHRDLQHLQALEARFHWLEVSIKNFIKSSELCSKITAVEGGAIKILDDIAVFLFREHVLQGPQGVQDRFNGNLAFFLYMNKTYINVEGEQGVVTLKR